MKLSLENRYLWDYMKFETLRQEVDASIGVANRWVLWDNKEIPQNILRAIGCLAGLTAECINRGSLRVGLPIEDGEHPTHEDNDWSVTAEQVYLSGRLSQENLQSLIDMKESDSRGKILFPGISVCHLNEKDAFNIFSEEHRSR